MSQEKYYEVYLSNALSSYDKPYTYSDGAVGTIVPGMLVEVPFGRGNKLRQAFVWREARTVEDNISYKTLRPLSATALLRADQFELALEMKRRYFCSLSQALAVMLPPSLLKTKAKTEKLYNLVSPTTAEDLLESGQLRSLGQHRVLEYLLDAAWTEASELAQACQVSSAVLSNLCKKGLLCERRREVARNCQPLPPSKEAEVLNLNYEQEQALQNIYQLLERAEGKVKEALLFGVTGSGKTEVYLRAAEAVLARGEAVLILVPEISLTPLICARINQRFGSKAAVLHSRLSKVERYEQWRSIMAGEKLLVAGARSAIFAPLAKIGLIVIDEEQESSYKSERLPRYNAIEVARIRRAQHQAVLLLASATPSLEQYYRCEQGRSLLLKLSARAGKAQLPEITLLDMRPLQLSSENIVAPSLVQALEKCFARHEQAMLFLNRRGHSSFKLCADCGYILRCPNCAVSLTEHKNHFAQQPNSPQSRQLICHYCGSIQQTPATCPECLSSNVQSFGLGTQQVEEWFGRTFPQYKALRMDQDTTLLKDAHAQLLQQFGAGEADCLIGTQMIAKGHDFPRVTLVGILSAEQMLALPDFRAEERAFQLLCQAAGRAGRREAAGQVFIQSYKQDNQVLNLAAQQDYESFYQLELSKRLRLDFPPALHLGTILLSGYNETVVARAARQVYRQLQQQLQKSRIPQRELKLFPVQIAPVAKIRRRWRYRLVLKSTSLARLHKLLAYAETLPLAAEVQLACDINPNSLS